MILVRINLVQHKQCSKMTLMTQRQESLIRAKNGHRIYTWHSSSWRWHSSADPTPENNTRGLGEQMHSSNEATQRCPQRHASPTSIYQFFERQKRQYGAPMFQHYKQPEWSSKVILLWNFTQRISTLGLAQMETVERIKSSWGGFTVQNLLTTKALVLWGFSIMHQRWHHSWILAKSLLRGAATAGLSAGLRTTASSVESSAQECSLFSTSSNISLV